MIPIADMLALNWMGTEVFSFLVSTLLKSSLFLALIGFFLWLARNSSAALRHAMISMSLAALLLLPFLTVLLPPVNLPVFSDWSAELGISDGAGDVGSQAGTRAEGQVTRTDTVVPKTGVAVHWTVWIMAIWAGGTLFVAARQIYGRWMISRLRRNAGEVEDETFTRFLEGFFESGDLPRTAVMISREISVPVLVGIWKPAILLPEEALRWPREIVDAALRHELAHARRLDTFSQLIAQIACVLLWFNPLVWILTNRLIVERERAADDSVINQGVRVSDFVKHLVEITDRVKMERKYAFNLAAMAQGTDFKDRMLNVLNPVADRTPIGLSAKLASAMIILLLLVPLSVVSPFDNASVPEQGRLKYGDWKDEAKKGASDRGRTKTEPGRTPIGSVLEYTGTVEKIDDRGTLRLVNLVGGTPNGEISIEADGVSVGRKLYRGFEFAPEADGYLLITQKIDEIPFKFELRTGRDSSGPYYERRSFIDGKETEFSETAFYFMLKSALIKAFPGAYAGEKKQLK